MKNVLTAFYSILIPLGLIAASVTDAVFHKKMFGYRHWPLDLALRLADLALRTTTLIISNEEINYIIEIVKSIEESGLLIKGVGKQLKMKQKSKRRISQYFIRHIRC